MIDFTAHVATRLRRLATGTAGETSQRDPIPGSAQVPNAAGGYAWRASDWQRLDRFLLLGTAGGTFYAGERELTREAAAAVERCLTADGPRVVARAAEVSEAGRAPSNDPALFVLAMAAGLGDQATRAAALLALPRVARTGTHLFHWLRYVRAFRGWGRGVRRAVGRWYQARTPAELAYQLTKYARRDGWAHRDALRLAHPAPPTATHALLFRYALRGWDGLRGATAGTTLAGADVAEPLDDRVLARLGAVQAVRAASPEGAARIIREQGLVREEVPTALLRHAAVWEALLPGMPLGALVRSLGVLTKVGLVAAGSDAARLAADRLADRAALRRARVHPVALLSAMKVYASGRGVRGRGAWAAAPEVVDALDAAFYLAFAAAPATGRRLLLALDVSGSMMTPAHGLPHVSCREASAAMALVTAATEPRHRFVAFTNGPYPSMHSGVGYGSGLTELAVSPRQRLDDVLRLADALPFGGTDCALPMVVALERGWKVDAFVVYTDSETWAGAVHPAQALRRYRERTGIAAKLVVVAMASSGFTIADPEDGGMLDVVGFDAAVPEVLAQFVSA